MSPSPASGWVFVRNENMSESGCFIGARLDAQLAGFSAFIEHSGSMGRGFAAPHYFAKYSVVYSVKPSFTVPLGHLPFSHGPCYVFPVHILETSMGFVSSSEP